MYCLVFLQNLLNLSLGCSPTNEDASVIGLLSKHMTVTTGVPSTVVCHLRNNHVVFWPLGAPFEKVFENSILNDLFHCSWCVNSQLGQMSNQLWRSVIIVKKTL